MKLTNKEVLEIWSCLNALAQKETSMWFTIGSNINKLKKDVDKKAQYDVEDLDVR